MLQDQRKQHRTGKNLKKTIISRALLPGLFISLQSFAADTDSSSLTPGQREAWDKMLFGGLGIMLVMVLFFLFLYLRTRKRKNKNPS